MIPSAQETPFFPSYTSPSSPILPPLYFVDIHVHPFSEQSVPNASRDHGTHECHHRQEAFRTATWNNAARLVQTFFKNTRFSSYRVRETSGSLEILFWMKSSSPWPRSDAARHWTPLHDGREPLRGSPGLSEGTVTACERTESVFVWTGSWHSLVWLLFFFSSANGIRTRGKIVREESLRVPFDQDISSTRYLYLRVKSRPWCTVSAVPTAKSFCRIAKNLLTDCFFWIFRGSRFFFSFF